MRQQLGHQPLPLHHGPIECRAHRTVNPNRKIPQITCGKSTLQIIAPNNRPKHGLSVLREAIQRG